jgi:thiamine transport system permease protein
MILKTLIFYHISGTIKFTFFQAFLACLISSILGFLFSLIFYFSNKDPKLISSFLNFCFILPVIFVSFGSIFFYSSNGILSIVFHWLSIDYDMKIFSLKGILYVTSYFNIALNANFFFRKLTNIPENYMRVLQSNGIPFLKVNKTSAQKIYIFWIFFSLNFDFYFLYWQFYHSLYLIRLS